MDFGEGEGQQETPHLSRTLLPGQGMELEPD